MMTLYIFGEQKAQHPDYVAKPFACLYCTSDTPATADSDRLAVIAAQETAKGRLTIIHAGPTAGRDMYPASPAPELAEALQRAGWVKCHAPLADEREQAIKLGVPV